MRIILGRELLRRAILLSPVGALPFLLFAGLLGCRESSFTVAPPGQTPTQFVFSPGDHAEYDNWKLDDYGYRITSSRFRSSWTVVDTAQRRFGFFPVVAIVDSEFAPSTGGSDSLVRVDTLIFYISPGGSIYQYGFLAALMKRREGFRLTPAWDQLAAFAAGGSGDFVVGYADSAKTRTVYGHISGQREFVPVVVNGVQTLILAYKIEAGALNLDLTIWVSDAPSAVLRVRDESNDVAPGTMKEITFLRTAGR